MFVAIAFYSKISVTKMKQACNAMLEDVRIQKLQNMDMMALEMERCNKFVNKTTFPGVGYIEDSFQRSSTTSVSSDWYLEDEFGGPYKFHDLFCCNLLFD